MQYWIQSLEGGPKRVNHASVAVGREIFLIGGYCSDNQLPDVIDVFAFHTGSLEWYRIEYSDTSDCPPGLYGHSVVAYNKKIYLWGGTSREAEGTSKLFCFDVASLSWSSVEVTGNVPRCLDGHSACVIENFMYVFGGFETHSEVLTNFLFRLNLDTFEWERVWAMGTPPLERDFHTASAIGDKMYIFGGRSFVEMTTGEKYENEMFCFEVSTCSWLKSATSGNEPRGRRSHSAAVYKGEIYIIGGCRPEYSAALKHLNDVHKYNPERNQWIEINVRGDGPCARRRHCSVIVEDHLYLFGGSSPITPDNTLEGLTPSQGSLEVFPPRLKEESDMYILDLSPTLKRLSQLKVIECDFVLNSLPINLQKEIAHLKKRNCTIQHKFARRDGLQSLDTEFPALCVH